jgi:regulator of sirC expression with transglutaminase-like and TPR domain
MRAPLEQLPRNQRREARRRLAALLSPGGPFDLAEAAFWVAAEEYPNLDVEQGLERIRLISAEGARGVYELANPFARLDGIATYIFQELGFRGNEEEYNDPRNSYLNEVLDRRLGIPLSLSILLMEVARAAGFDVRGIGLPGHFISRLTFEGRTLLVDAYHGGRVITEEDCLDLVKRTTGRPSLFRRELLQGVDERGTLARMLLNLKHLYLKREDYGRALSMVERLLLIAPNDSSEIRDRGFLNAHLGRPGAAVADLECYLTIAPEAPDVESVRGRVLWLRRRLSEMN